MIHTLIALVLIFTELSVLAFGGGNTILPEMQRQVVEVHGWMTAADFSALFALGQAAPGPNLMVVTLVGWHVAGLPGVLATTIAKFGPSSLITVIALGLWEKFKDRPWRGVIQAGIFPMTVGLVAASASLITEASVHTWLLGAIAAIVAVLGSVTRIHPLWLLFAGALAGLLVSVSVGACAGPERATRPWARAEDRSPPCSRLKMKAPGTAMPRTPTA